MKLVIVESPSKAQTINKYLGKDFKVIASYGHIRDVPAKNNSIRPGEDFAMDWEVQDRGKKTVAEIVKNLEKADELYLASDPDREGEAIAWHVFQELKRRKKIKKDLKVHRVVFHEITKTAVQKAMDNPKEIDMNLVEAYLARRALDYLVGFHISPLLWRKLPGAKSAGRVQSVALRLVCDREKEINSFIKQEYWGIDVDLQNSLKDEFTARLTQIDGKKLEKFSLPNREITENFHQEIEKSNFTVGPIEKKQIKRNPAPPFTTSTLQQEASRKLGFGAKKTMQIAQQLYEGIEVNGDRVGLITYMRTDAVALAEEAVLGIRKLIEANYGKEFLPEKQRFYKNSSKNAQEAHEAIRPTDASRIPEKTGANLSSDQLKLYTLIWKRTVACQMENAIFDQVGADILSQDKKFQLRATGQTISFPGFIKVYKEDIDDKKEEDEGMLPPLKEGENLKTIAVHSEQHFTEPPPRFTEASLVKKMEELGIGRPSTYASILSVLQERSYVHLEAKRFIPEQRGKLVIAFLERYFNQYVQYDYTAGLEDKLDDITNGEIPWKKVLNEFWIPFSKTVEGVGPVKMQEVLDAILPELENDLFKKEEDRICPNCHEKSLHLKLGKFGAFIGCSHYPDCNYTKPLEGGIVSENEGEDPNKTEENELGRDENGQEISLKKGPYGFYVQAGVGKESKKVSVPKGYDLSSIDKERALLFLQLPKTLGKNTDNEEEIKVNIGRFGPYICEGKKYHSIPMEKVFTIQLEEALALLKQEKSKKEVVELGKWKEELITYQIGRYGPYVKSGKVMASVKKGGIPNLEEAIKLIEEKIGKK